MGLDLSNPLIEMKITSVVCSTAAVLSTFYRLFIRRGRFWWDDAWALFSMLALFCQIASVFMHVPNPAELTKVNRVAAYYLMATSFYAIIWAARLSILFSIIRLDPSPFRKRVLLYIAGVYFTVTLFLISQLFWVCEPENIHNQWKNAASPQCTLNKQVAISQLVSDILADMVLIIAPLKLFSELGDRRLRVRLFAIFSTCVVTTIVSLVHAAYILTLGGPKVLIAALVEDCMSLFVANVPIVATALFKLREKPATSAKIPTGMTKMSTNIFFNRKTETAVDGTVVTLGGLTTTQQLSTEDPSKTQGTVDSVQSLYPEDKEKFNPTFSTTSDHSTSSASYNAV